MSDSDVQTQMFPSRLRDSYHRSLLKNSFCLEANKILSQPCDAAMKRPVTFHALSETAPWSFLSNAGVKH